MNKIHHFVHLGYDKGGNHEYEKSVLSKLNQISENIRKGVNNVIILVELPIQNLEEDIFRFAGILSEFLFLTYLGRIKGKELQAKMSLYKHFPKEMIDDLYNLFDGKEDVTDRLLIQISQMNGRKLKKVSMIWKIIYHLNNIGILRDKSYRVGNFDELYLKALKYLTRKYSSNKIWLEGRENLVEYSNFDFREKVESILSIIPEKNIIRIEMTESDVPYHVYKEWKNGINPFSQCHQKATTKHSQMFLNRIYRIQVRRRMEYSLNVLRNSLGELGIDIKEVKHRIGGEYRYKCTHNYGGFLSKILGILESQIKIDKEISLEKR